MATAQIPKINQSLKSFSIFIQTAWILGASLIVIGLLWLAGASRSYDLAGVSWSIGLAYFGSGLISLAVISMLLRQTAKVIVDGLGGTVQTNDWESRQGSPNLDAWNSPERVLGGTLTVREYDAWINASQPSLEGYDKTKHPDFLTWLEQQKTK